jgi:hypothetical protein
MGGKEFHIERGKIRSDFDYPVSDNMWEFKFCRAVHLRKKGFSYAKIAEIMGLKSKGMIHDYVQKANVLVNRGVRTFPDWV